MLCRLCHEELCCSPPASAENVQLGQLVAGTVIWLSSCWRFLNLVNTWSGLLIQYIVKIVLIGVKAQFALLPQGHLERNLNPIQGRLFLNSQVQGAHCAPRFENHVPLVLTAQC